jgi:hypothetical protein
MEIVSAHSPQVGAPVFAAAAAEFAIEPNLNATAGRREKEVNPASEYITARH